MGNHAKQHEVKKKLKTFLVLPDESGLRLDRWFKRHFPALSHGQMQKMLRTGQIRLDGKRATSCLRISEGQKIRVPPQLIMRDFSSPAKASVSMIRNARWLKDTIIYEDDDVIALNKPAGVAVQGGTGIRESIDDFLMIFSRDGKTRPKLVHRLDRDTSGVLLIARNDFAAASLASAFRSRDTEKIYWALTLGVPKPAEGCIELPLLKSGGRMIVADKMENNSTIKKATTLYQVIDKISGKTALVELRPLTGRTHQLRVHMASIGTPILGDRIYGGDVFEKLPVKELGSGLHLHARRIVLRHPRGGIIDATAPLGSEMLKTLKWFGLEGGDRD